MSSSTIITSPSFSPLTLDTGREESKEAIDIATTSVAISRIEEYVISINWLCKVVFNSIKSRKFLHNRIINTCESSVISKIDLNIINCTRALYFSFYQLILQSWFSDKSLGLDIPDYSLEFYESRSKITQFDVLNKDIKEFLPKNHKELEIVAKKLLYKRERIFRRLKKTDFCKFIAYQCKLDSSSIFKMSMNEPSEKMFHSLKNNDFYKEFLHLATDERQPALFQHHKKTVRFVIKTLIELHLAEGVVNSVIIPYFDSFR